jgi:hypothetical protein
VRLTSAVALSLRYRLPEAGLAQLMDARDRAGEIGAAAFPVPWDRSLVGFASVALHRLGLSW